MSGWLRFENSTAENPKLVPLSDRAFRLWFNACCYCSRVESDGLVPRSIITRLSRTATRSVVQELVAAGRFELADDVYYLVHDYLEHNPSKERLGEMRRATADRVAQWRERNGNDVSNGQGNALVTPPRTRGPRDRSVDVPSCVVPSNDEGNKSRRASKRVDQNELPASLPTHLHPVAAEALPVLRAVHGERGGDEPTLRGVGLAMSRFPNRDHSRVVRELEHWALAGTGQARPVKDWCRTFATFLERSPAGSPVKTVNGGASRSALGERRRRGVAALDSLMSRTGGDAA